jgi:hypothetical protein
LELSRAFSRERVDADSVFFASCPRDVDSAHVGSQDEVVEPLVDSIEVQVRNGSDDIDGFAFELPKRGRRPSFRRPGARLRR